MTIIRTFNYEYEDKAWKQKKYLLPTGILLMVLILAEVWANNVLVTYGEKFENISRLQVSLELENQILENEIAKGSSLANIASKSAALGFSNSESIQYIR